MSLARIFLAVSVVLFGAIGAAAYYKKKAKAKDTPQVTAAAAVSPALAPTLQPIEIDLAAIANTVVKPGASAKPMAVSAAPHALVEGKQEIATDVASQASRESNSALVQDSVPDVDQTRLLFSKNSPLPIVQTIQYKAKVPWKTGRSAWLVDYASHYKTHLTFLARSVNGKPDYTARAVADGESFNVLSQNVNFYFYLLVDLSRCKMKLFTVMPDTQERVLLKTYNVGLGRLDSSKKSGLLTPLGKYSLGSRIAIFQPKMMGNHKGKKVELMTVFGTRWIPFEKEIEGCTEPAKGFGIHGTPWQPNEAGKLVDRGSGIGKYESDGCIRLYTPDIEEVFAIVSTRKTVIEIVPDFSKAKLPGKESFY